MLSFILFADDSNIFFSHSNPDTLVNVMNKELKNVNSWIHANRLSLNLDKTNYMLFSKTLSLLPNPILFNTTTLQRVQSTEFLGGIR